MKRGYWHELAKPRTSLLLLAVIGAAWIWIARVPSGVAGARSPLPAAPALGHPAPDFTLTALDGQSGEASHLVALAELRGKPVIVNFWATWCQPCRAELPALQAASAIYDGQVIIVGINQAEPADTVRKFAREAGLGFPILMDVSGKASYAYAVRSLPTTFFLDRNGMIRRIQTGPLTGATLAQAVQAIYPR